MTDHTEGLPHLQFSREALKAGPRKTLAIAGNNTVKFYGVEGKEAYHYVFSALKGGVILTDTPFISDLETLGQRSNDDNMSFSQVASELPADKGIYCCIGLPLLEQNEADYV